jgi:hypothetical protein
MQEARQQLFVQVEAQLQQAAASAPQQRDDQRRHHHRVAILVDDNNHYTSMRHELCHLARRSECPAARLWLLPAAGCTRHELKPADPVARRRRRLHPSLLQVPTGGWDSISAWCSWHACSSIGRCSLHDRRPSSAQLCPGSAPALLGPAPPLQEEALRRNAARPAACRVPADVISRMARLLEEPAPDRHSWEQGTVVLDTLQGDAAAQSCSDG